MHGFVPYPAAVPVPDEWRTCRDYLHAIDLWNHGYYWEAHEAWEGLWHAVGRHGLLADFFKGLIKLAAVGVKVRERRPAGGARHARRAAELFAITIERLRAATSAQDATRLMGLDVAELQRRASRFAATHEQSANEGPLPSRKELPPTESVFDFYLMPS
ncbi:MAG: DUF309 domain-containing protein [Planctomycetia bacterium]|nr:DUF309 domain-containing protein [Planctomycetia bacterium]